jgi:hypothetical protein
VSGNFVKFIGGAGSDGNSIFPIYADDAAGSNQSFDPSGKTFVTFFESTTTPTLPVSGQTFVEYVGEDGYTPVLNVDYFNGTDGVSIKLQYSGDNTNWHDTLLSTDNYIRTGTKTPPATTYTYGTGTKFVPEKGVEYDDGDPGTNAYLHIAYADTSSGDGFSQSPTGKDYIGSYSDSTEADSTTASDYTWALIKGADGQTGASTNIIFLRSATAPSTPSPSSGIPSGWYDSPPSGTELIWASNGTKLVGATNFTWGTPWQVEGAAIAEVSIYRLNSSSGGTGGSYDFVTQTLTPPSDWFTDPPSLASNGDTIYRKSGVASGAATQTSASVSYGPAVVYAKRTDGTDGTNGTRGAGRWNIGVTSLPTTSSEVNTAFVAAIGQPVDRDQAWFYTGTVANPTSQGVWLYDAGTPVWNEQDEVIDGNLLVSGTVNAAAIAISDESASNKIEIVDNKILVYNNGVLRVKIGDLS